MILAADPTLYEAMFLDEDEVPVEQIDWMIPSSEEEINSIMKMIEEAENASQHGSDNDYAQENMD